jgi:diguanylate cyclase (GGDEF)-like protein/PAS domain S-box-containing protein
LPYILRFSFFTQNASAREGVREIMVHFRPVHMISLGHQNPPLRQYMKAECTAQKIYHGLHVRFRFATIRTISLRSRTIRLLGLCCLLSLFCIFIVRGQTNAASLPRLHVTTEPLVVAGGDTIGHFSRRNSQGAAEGLLVDLWKLWAEQTDHSVVFRLGSMEQARSMLRKGEADILLPVLDNPRLLDSMDFSDPIYSMPAYLFYADDIRGVRDIDDLKGLRVGVVKNSAFDYLLAREAPFGTTIIGYPDRLSMVKAAALGEVHAFIEFMPLAQHYLSTFGATDRFKYAGAPVGTFTVHAAVKKGNRKLLREINQGLAALDQSRREALRKKWEGKPLAGAPNWNPLLFSLGVLGLFVLGALVWNWQLRRRVKLATMRLSASNAVLQREIGERKNVERNLRERETQLEQFFMCTPIGIAIQDTLGKFTSVNPAFERIFGFTLDEINHGRAMETMVPEVARDEFNRMRSRLLKGESIDEEAVRCRRDGSFIHVHISGFPIVVDDRTQGYYRVYQDITSRKAAERQLTHQAFHDSLTGLPNRTLFLDRLERAMARQQRNRKTPFAVLFLDLDRFKVVNDSLGHDAGDKLIMEVAARLTKCVRRADTVARIGGDEFAVLVEEMQDRSMAETVAKRIIAQMSLPTVIDEHELHTTTSIGIVIGAGDRLHPENVLRDADIAMYRAKDAGRGGYRVFDKTMRIQATETMQLENDLRRAIEREEFELHYQPIVNLKTNEVSSLEALIRWNHPKRGLVFPDEFLPLAEETGLIIPMSLVTIRTAMRQLSIWQNNGVPSENMTMSVNLSASQFLQPQLPDDIQRTAREFNIAPSRIHVEITESAMLKCTELAKRIIRDLRRMGTSIVMDDFGTGYSSLSYLHQFNVDKLKIDRSFIMNMNEEPESGEIAKTIVLLGHNLGMEVVAEGVEVECHVDTLRRMQCDYAQGYLIAKPLPPVGAEKFLRASPEVLRPAIAS